jgi:DNA replication and repair protein RecF
MLVRSVVLSNFRNIEQAKLETDKTVNVFYGKNGGGKTSVLEALFYLGRAKSFRTSKRKTLINNAKDEFAVSALINQGKRDQRLGIGLKENGESLIKLDGEVVTRLSEASSLFPTQVITPESFDVFFSSPKARRSFIDFGLFHVEQGYQNKWAEYARIHKQTNALLRRGNANKIELQYWYKSLIDSAEQIESFRKAFFSKYFSKAISKLANELPDSDTATLIRDVELRYKPKTFNKEQDNFEQLVALQIEKDLRYKQVGFGPNRADIIFIKAGDDVSNQLSRGQSKMLFYLLEIAMVKIIREVTNKNMLLLVDDLPSEVDEFTRGTMLQMLLQSEAQIFVTGIENKIAMEFKNYTDSVNVFHVEHGTVTPKSMEQLCP